MNAADAYNLATSSLTRAVGFCDAADEDVDADPWLVIDDIRALCADTLAHLEVVRLTRRRRRGTSRPRAPAA